MNQPFQYSIHVSTSSDSEFLDDSIVAFNKTQVPPTQSEDFISFNYHARDKQNNIIAGINALMYCWGTLYIDVLFVDERYRDQQLGSYLLQKVETEAQSKGAHLSHLDTFDWQAKDFYLKAGYEIFGTLEDCPLGHQRYYLKKKL